MAQDFVFYRDTKKKMPVIARGEGIYLWDTEGNKYIDGCSGALVSSIGHGRTEISDAIREAASQVAFVHLSQFTNKYLQQLSAEIASITPGDLNWCYFVSGGSEAADTAIKMARQYHMERGQPSRYKVIGRWQAFHGNTIGAMSVGGHTARRKMYAPLLLDFPHAVPGYCYRCPYGLSHPACSLACADDVERIILQEGPENIAAFMCEIVSGASAPGVHPPAEYYKKIRKVCDAYGVLFIADEVMTGFGRTGEYFACEHYDVLPDMIICAKGMSAGYAPIGAVIASERVYQAFNQGSGRFIHGYTYGGNPVSAAASLRVISFLKEHGVLENVKSVGNYLKDRLSALASEHPIIGDVRGLGLMQGVELVACKETRQPFPQQLEVTNRLKAVAFKRGLLVYPGAGCVNGRDGDAILIAPPLTITVKEVDELLEVFEEALSVVESELLNS